MNKEEIDKWLDNEYGMSYTRLEELHDFYFEKYCDLQQENKQLKEKIDKAIAYIENWKIDFYDYECENLIINKNELEELEKILKGE